MRIPFFWSMTLHHRTNRSRHFVTTSRTFCQCCSAVSQENGIQRPGNLSTCGRIICPVLRRTVSSTAHVTSPVHEIFLKSRSDWLSICTRFFPLNKNVGLKFVESSAWLFGREQLAELADGPTGCGEPERGGCLFASNSIVTRSTVFT